MPTKSVKDHRYLIIGGTTKSATTSLFTYLTDHPEICAASYKETRFFLDKDYPLPSKYRFHGDAEEYNSLFTQCDDNQLRLESTPDYLYCSTALTRIATFLPNTKLVFSLREPISRLISWYRFGQQIARLPKSLSFDGYVDHLFSVLESQSSEEIDENKIETHENIIHEQYMQTLQQGCYATYLKQYLEQFGNSRIHTLFFEDLVKDPLHILKDICDFAGIDAGFYEDYTFKVTNRTETMRSSEFHQKYRSFRFHVRRWTHNKPIIHQPLRVMRKAIEPLYLRLNTRSDEGVKISQNTNRRLVEYYLDDIRELTKLIGKKPPWKPFEGRLNT